MTIRNIEVLLLALMLSAAACMLGSCGQKGDLYLPDRSEAQPSQAKPGY